MDFSTFTVKAQEAIAGAQERARAAGNPETTTHHLLLALTDERDSVADVLLRASEADTARVRRTSEEAIAKLPSVRGQSVNAPAASLGFRSVLERAYTEARALGDSFT
ncbi:MAG: ATP-dependent Clp protease ATP-binding subunit ClpB, partial [Gaiellales bacterium]|nr:ATP-dependent Clp protease ATP-binding subunit ClpB [Gaiellales bacterium]